MRHTIKRWGNSAAVRLPAPLLAALHLTLNDPVDLREEGGRIIITPIRSPAYDLEALLGAITPENLHAEADFGEPEGREIL